MALQLECECIDAGINPTRFVHRMEGGHERFRSAWNIGHWEQELKTSRMALISFPALLRRLQ